MNFFAKNIATLRKSFKATQAEISKAIGLKRNTWSNYENAASEPSFEGLIKIANYFDISLTQLLEIDLAENEELMHEIISRKESGKNKYAAHKTSSRNSDNHILNEEPVPYKTQQEVIESLTSAVKGLEASNSYLIIENQRLRTENDSLKKKNITPAKQKNS